QTVSPVYRFVLCWSHRAKAAVIMRKRKRASCKELSLRTLEQRVVELHAVSDIQNPRLLDLLTLFEQYGAIKNKRPLGIAVIHEFPGILQGGRTPGSGFLVFEPENMKGLGADVIARSLLIFVNHVQDVQIQAFLFVLAYQAECRTVFFIPQQGIKAVAMLRQKGI